MKTADMLNLSVGDIVFSLSQDCFGVVQGIRGDNVTVFFADSYRENVQKSDLYWDEIIPQKSALKNIIKRR